MEVPGMSQTEIWALNVQNCKFMIRRIINKMSLGNAQNQIQNLLPSKLMRWMNSPGQMLSGSMLGLSRTIL